MSPRTTVGASEGRAPLVLVDERVLAGGTAALPDGWLAGMRPVGYRPGDLDPASIGEAHAAEAIVLRSATRLDAGHLAQLPALRAVATLSSGEDHVDVDALSARGVGFSTGRGGNARAVRDWVCWAIERLAVRATDGPAVIVGVGAVGAAVDVALRTRGFETLLVDPPRAARDRRFAHVPLEDALGAGPALVTLHTPRVRSGRHATVGLMGAAEMSRLGRGRTVILQASRGGVLDEAAAAGLRREGHLRGLALDVFAHEPSPAPAVVQAADLATAHIGGHSIEGKLDVARRALVGLRVGLGLDTPTSAARRLDLQAAARSVIGRAGLTTDALEPWAALDRADVELRAAVGAGEPFHRVRDAHRRVERDV
jgi:erythronate-4-phosphate dehydrogenase